MREIQADQRAEHCQRQCHQHDTSWPRAPEKNKDHCSREQKPERRFLHKVADGLAHINRLIHHHVETDPFDAFKNRLELRFDSFDDCDRISARLPIDRNVNLPFALHADDVRLDLVRIFDLRDVADVSRRTVANSQR